MEYLARRSFLVIFIFVFLLNFLLEYVFKLENNILRGAISAGLAVFLSPRKKKIQTQTGVKTQITWIFLKTPIFLEN